MLWTSISEILYRSDLLFCVGSISHGKMITPASDISTSEFVFIWANPYDTFQMGKVVIHYSNSNGFLCMDGELNYKPWLLCDALTTHWSSMGMWLFARALISSLAGYLNLCPQFS